MRAFTKFAFTEKVKDVQSEMGSREIMENFSNSARENKELGPAEIGFILERDSFFMASMSETGWPYIQHRGGPKGFLKVLSNNMMGMADFSGNMQYISRGNLRSNPRVHLFLVDYANQRRLKIWALAGESTDPRLIAELVDEDYPAKVESALIFEVQAFDWNCNQHIPRLVPSGEPQF